MKTLLQSFNKCKLLILVFCFVGNIIHAQTTYTWNVASGNFLSPNSWTPSRTTTAINDVLVFDGNVQATPIVNNISSQTIGRLRIINGANVNFASALLDTQVFEIIYTYSDTLSNFFVIGNNTNFLKNLRTNDVLFNPLDTFNPIFIDTIYNDTLVNVRFMGSNFHFSRLYYLTPKLVFKDKSTLIPSFEISANSTLEFNCEKPYLSLFVDSGSFANIYGSIKFKSIRGDVFNAIRGGNRLIGFDSNSIVVKNSGSIRVENEADNKIFGLFGSKNTVLFDSGATFYTSRSTSLIGGFKFGIIKVVFKKGSNFILGQGSLDRGINYGNVFLPGEKQPYALLQSNQSFPELSNITNIENLTIASNILNVSETVLNNEVILNIKGNLIVQNNANFIIGSQYSTIFSGTTTINFNGNQPQIIGGSGVINVFSTNNSPVRVNFKNPKGIFLSNNLNLSNSQVILDTGFINLNGYHLTIGEDSTKFGNLKVKNGYITGNGTLTKWYPANNIVTNNIDSTLFPFGTNSAKRNIWVTGNAVKAGTITIAHNNLLGYTHFAVPFTDSSTNNVVNVRQNYNWNITTNNGLKGGNFTIKAIGDVDTGYTNLPTDIRLTLAQEKAPGLALNGTGTAILPMAIRTNLTDSNLNNTFYLGANSSICFPPTPPIVSNRTICQNTITSLSAIGSGTISWYSDSVGGNYLGSGLSFTTPTLTNTVSYYVQDSTCAASSRTKVTVFVLSKPIVGLAINNNNQCVNNNQFEFTDTSTINQGNITRLWKINNLDTSTNISFTQKFKAIGNYTIQLKVSNSINNSCSDSVTKTFVIKPKPTVLINANATVVCQGQPVTLNGNGAQTYSWSNGVLNGIAFYPLVNKTYTVIGTDSNNCTDTATINITVNKKPTIVASASINPVCAKVPIVLTGSGGIHYFWSDGILNGVPFVPSSTKTYLLTALNSEGCSDTATVNLVVKPLPNVSTTKNKTMITANQSGAAYQWLNCNTSKSVIVGANNQSYVATVNGNYAVIITQNGCSDTSVCVNT